ncbi:amidase [Alicyclobacillus cellulosilyticus]|uniref:Amidase n=1 Tax=Alicyclobacillus cellulosilyticus TaxID=1003997 RepID=A0A917K7H8_9BACL|nr:amidase [Alicyclobacillus cellulosilyticus]GGJ03489.1 amidase [Alicyclobacillus cellulosilyticus]
MDSRAQAITDMTLVDLVSAVKARHISPVEVVAAVLRRIEAWQPRVNAFITVCAEAAVAKARVLEQQLMRGGAHGALFGAPVAVKDIVYTRGVRTTMGSRWYEDFIPDDDAAVVERIRAAGGIVIGKVNTHELAYGPTGDCSWFGPARNPHDPARMTGGSSSGSAAAVAAGLCHAAVGTDTGGSIRIPSALCGVVGMKPTFGRVSTYGVHPLAPSLDHVGPLTQSVLDNAVFLSVLAGYDRRDGQSARRPPEDFTRGVGRPVAGWRVGLPEGEWFECLHPDVAGAVDRVVRILQDLGARAVPVALPPLAEMVWALDVVQRAEVFDRYESVLAARGSDLHPEVRARMEQSAHPRGYEYVRAKRMQEVFTAAVEEVFAAVDVLLMPAVAVPAQPLGAREVELCGERRPLVATLLLRTRPFNLTGHPALAQPCGWTADGLPVAVQWVGPRFGEARLYQVAHAVEQALPQHGRRLPSCLDLPTP